MPIEFALPYKQTIFGPVGDPRVLLTARTPLGPRDFRFLIDTGADFSLAPRSLADVLTLNWETLPGADLVGVAPETLRARLGSLPLRLQDRDLTVRCLFADIEECPLVLGWADFLDRFVLTIDPLRRRIVLEDAL